MESGAGGGAEDPSICYRLLRPRWLAEGRVQTDGCRVVVDRARFDSYEFSPALDYPEAMSFERPFPSGAKSVQARTAATSAP
jgi:hypothetical protein